MKTLKDFLPESFLVELSDGPMDSGSPISGGEADAKTNPENSKGGKRELRIGDPVIIKSHEFMDNKGIVDDMTDENVIIVDVQDKGKHKFNIQDVEFDPYSDDNEEADYRRQLENFKKLSGY